jgi:hypothetical protein
MRKTKIILGSALALFFLLNFSFTRLSDKRGQAAEQSVRPAIEQDKDVLPASQTAVPLTAVKQESSAPKAASFILVTDALDGFGGQKQNTACDRYVFAGGQSSPIGSGTSTNFSLYAGFVYPVVVKCGDANADGKITVSDVVYLVNYLFKGGPAAKPYEAGEANCDGRTTVSDVVYLVNYLFKGGPLPIC